MSAAHVEFDLTLPSDRRFHGVLRDAVASAARAAGCRNGDADALARSVEDAAGACAERSAGDGVVSVVVRRGPGVLEVSLACDGIARVLSMGTTVE